MSKKGSTDGPTFNDFLSRWEMKNISRINCAPYPQTDAFGTAGGLRQYLRRCVLAHEGMFKL